MNEKLDSLEVEEGEEIRIKSVLHRYKAHIIKRIGGSEDYPAFKTNLAVLIIIGDINPENIKAMREIQEDQDNYPLICGVSITTSRQKEYAALAIFTFLPEMATYLEKSFQKFKKKSEDKN